MNAELFIVSYRRDFRYLVYCLRSIDKFAKEFGLTLVVPDRDFEEAVALCRQTPEIPTHIVSGQEWPGQGMLWHFYEILFADERSPKADVFLHIDSDCVFTEPVYKSDYIVNGKPLLLFESFASLGPKHPEILRWRDCTRQCLPFEPLYETMRRHPEVYHRGLYKRTRELIEFKVQESLESYLKKQRNEYPQSFCEHVTLGNVAIHEFSELYELYDLEKKPWPEPKLAQAWSHREVQPGDHELYKKLGLE